MTKIDPDPQRFLAGHKAIRHVRKV